VYSWHFVGVVYYRTQGKVKDISHLNLAVEEFYRSRAAEKASNVIQPWELKHQPWELKHQPWDEVSPRAGHN